MEDGPAIVTTRAARTRRSTHQSKGNRAFGEVPSHKNPKRKRVPSDEAEDKGGEEDDEEGEEEIEEPVPPPRGGPRRRGRPRKEGKSIHSYL